MAAAIFIGLSSSGAAEADGTSSTDGRAQSVVASVTAPEKCPSARKAVAFYRGKYKYHRARMGARPVPLPKSERRTPACSHARFHARVWRSRALVAREAADYMEVIRRKRLANPTQAICYVFGSYCQQALRVASCESGRGVYAQNGQYLGMFQMGSYARAAYGHSYTALGQAKAAYAYFVASGRDWSPWSCRP